jgi:hypothetical protein
MNKKMIKQGVSVVTMVPLAFPIYAFGWQAPSKISNAYESNRMKQQLNQSNGNIMNLLDSGIANLNDDVGLLEVHLTAEEAKTSPIIRLTRHEPVVMAVEDPQHDRAVIQAISSQRHSDGSATVRQKTIRPDDFKPKSSGGMLTNKQHEILINAYGGANPADVLNGRNGDHVWYGTDPMTTQAMMGIIMQYLGATHGYYVVLEPSVRSWTTSSGGPFTKKITTHVDAHFTPHWTFLTPLDVGADYGAPNMPIFQIKGKDNKNYAVRGGVNAFNIGATNNFRTSREHLYYESKTESGFTGFALVFTAIVIGALTGGAGLVAGLGAIGGGAAAGAAALVGLTISGAELHDPVAGDFGDLFLKSATAGIDTRKKNLESSFGNGWRHELVDVVKSGPIDGNKNFNNEFRRELRQWDNIVRPND